MNMVHIWPTVLSHVLVRAPISEHAPLVKYWHTEVNCNIYNIGAPVCSIISQTAVRKKCDYTVHVCTFCEYITSHSLDLQTQYYFEQESTTSEMNYSF